MPENQIYKPSYLGVLPITIFLGIFSLSFFPVLIITAPILIFMYLSISMTSYELNADGLFIKKGVIAKKQILLLYTQIQDVTEYQGLWEMITGLKTLQIKTMTKTSALAGNLNYLNDKDADTLKQVLMQQVNSKSKKTNSIRSINTAIDYDINKEQDEKTVNPYPLHFIRLGVLSGVFSVIIVIIITIVAIGITNSLEVIFNLLIWIIIALTIPIRYVIDQFTFQYWVSENTITIKSGLLNTQKTSIEYEKVQDVILSQGLFERILGLATIHIETGSVTIAAGNENKRVPNYDIKALKLEDAKTLTNKIMKNAGMNYTPLAKPLVEQIPLSQKKILKKTLSGLVGLFIFIGIGLTIFFVIASSNDAISGDTLTKIITWTGIVCAVIAIWTVIYQKMYYDRYFYDWSRDTLTIKKGVIWRQQIFLRFEKIQNVFRDQDLFDRIFSIYDVHVSTVGDGSVAMCHIDGLTKENSDKMLAVLMRQVKANM